MKRFTRVESFETLRHMWFGGAGEFGFVNLKAMRTFMLKFVPIKRFMRRTNESVVWCCFIHTSVEYPQPNYAKIGKYNFDTNAFSLASTQPYVSKDVLDLLLMSFDWAKKHIYHNESFVFSEPWKHETLVKATCCRCGLDLSRDDSVKRGYGDECESFVTKQLPRQLQLQIR